MISIKLTVQTQLLQSHEDLANLPLPTKQDLGSTALRLSIWSRVLILVQMSSRLSKVSPDFDRQVTNCFMKMCLLISRVCRWSHQHLSSDPVWDFVCHFLGNIRRHSEDMWTLGVCDFFNCLKNVKSCIEIIHFRDDFYKKSSIFNFLLAILYFF